MRSLKLSLVAVLLLGSFSLTRATSSEETVAQLRARFAKIVEIDAQYYAAPEELRRDIQRPDSRRDEVQESRDYGPRQALEHTEQQKW